MDAYPASLQVKGWNSTWNSGEPWMSGHNIKLLKASLWARRGLRLSRPAGFGVLPAHRLVVTTDSDHDQPIAPDLLQRDFTATHGRQGRLNLVQLC